VRPAVISAPMWAEWAALRAGGLTVRHTGMGPRRSALRASEMAGQPVLVAGVGGGLDPAVRPGDLVVASEVRGPAGDPVASPSAPLLAGALRRLGLTVHIGPLVSSARVVDGPGRIALAGTGGLAVDTETAWLAPDGEPFAAVRAIVDTAEHPLWSVGTPARGIAALDQLRRAAPALADWVAALRPREVLLANPAGMAYAMQTTPAVDGAGRTGDVLRQRSPGLQAPGRDATTDRQQAVRAMARDCDLVVVLGSGSSSNSLRLVEVAEREGTPAVLADDAAEVDLAALAGAARVGVTAGASAPPHLVDELVHGLTGLGPVTLHNSPGEPGDVHFTLPREVT
jgi:4-hydroxy-3-methylbut-2-en-1-yl diphosphate reductase